MGGLRSRRHREAVLSAVHVGLNLVYLVPGESGGMEVYARELIPRLVAAAPHHRFTTFLSREAHASPGPWHELTGSVLVPVNANNRVEWVRGEQQLLPPLAQRAGIDLLHSLANTAPGWGRFRRVVTIHDLIHRAIPDSHSGLRALGMRILVPLAARRSHGIIADSNATAGDVKRFLHVASEKIDVVPLGVGTTRRVAPRPEAELRAWLRAGDRPLVLSVSAKRAHKNLMRLIDAMARTDEATRPLLVLPGYHTDYEDRLRAHADATGVQRDVRFLGWVSPEDLEGLYAASACFVFPSLAEGFGLPILEAMGRDVPVACSDRGAIAEVAGDAALLFDPTSPAEIARAMTRLLRDDELARRLREAGRRRVEQFSWEATAVGTLASYERARGGGTDAARSPVSAGPA